jgi:hypothetical protein
VSDIKGLNTPIKKDQTGICVQKNPKAIAKGINKILETKNYQKARDNLKKKPTAVSVETLGGAMVRFY